LFGINTPIPYFIMNKTKGLPGGRNQYHRINVTLSKANLKFLDSLRSMIFDRTGKSVGKTEIVRAALRFIGDLKINPENITDEDSLYLAMKEAIRKS
jgi:hypothetical protein